MFSLIFERRFTPNTNQIGSHGKVEPFLFSSYFSLLLAVLLCLLRPNRRLYYGSSKEVVLLAQALLTMR